MLDIVKLREMVKLSFTDDWKATGLAILRELEAGREWRAQFGRQAALLPDDTVEDYYTKGAREAYDRAVKDTNCG
jgi:hypothetical protein